MCISLMFETGFVSLKLVDDLDQSQSITHLWGNQMKNREIDRNNRHSLQYKTLSDTTLKTIHFLSDYSN